MNEPKPKLLVCILCGLERTHWINPLLFEHLQCVLFDGRLAAIIHTAYNIDRVEVARNRCVQYARDNGADFLVMIDNDMVPPPNFRDVLLEIMASDKAVVSFRSAHICSKDGQTRMIPVFDNGTRDGHFQETGLAGSGIMVLNVPKVCGAIPRGPWFKWPVNDDELLSRKQSEDYWFCELAHEHGLSVWLHDSIAGHLKTSDITKR